MVFLWWCFRQAGAAELFYGGSKTASCRQLLSYHKRQAVTDYQPGDIIFYNFHGKATAEHVGICEISRQAAPHRGHTAAPSSSSAPQCAQYFIHAPPLFS